MKISKSVIEAIARGDVGVMPTDTIYGIVASINFPASIERIYRTKARAKSKAMVHLVGDISQLSLLGVEPSKTEFSALEHLWPGPVSVIFDCDYTLAYVKGDKPTIAVRLPRPLWLRELVKATGPIVATSANLSGKPSLHDINEIERDLPGLDFYVNGPVGTTPSKLARIDPDGQIYWVAR